MFDSDAFMFCETYTHVRNILCIVDILDIVRLDNPHGLLLWRWPGRNLAQQLPSPSSFTPPRHCRMKPSGKGCAADDGGCHPITRRMLVCVCVCVGGGGTSGLPLLVWRELLAGVALLPWKACRGWRRRLSAGNLGFPWFGGCGSHEGGMAVDPRCSLLWSSRQRWRWRRNIDGACGALWWCPVGGRLKRLGSSPWRCSLSATACVGYKRLVTWGLFAWHE
jgi:hypothetical protein